jgi:hypothetical protein
MEVRNCVEHLASVLCVHCRVPPGDAWANEVGALWFWHAGTPAVEPGTQVGVLHAFCAAAHKFEYWHVPEPPR